MRQRLWIGASLTAMVGLAAWAPPPANSPLSQIEATPRLYQISASGLMERQNGAKVCLGGDAFRQLVSGFQALNRDPSALKALSKGCTTQSTHDGASMNFDQDCKKANGAAITSHMHISGTPDQIHQHMEMALPGLGPNGSDKPMVSDMTMTRVGPCPASMKPGDIMMADGTIVNPLAAMTDATKEAGDTGVSTGPVAPK